MAQTLFEAELGLSIDDLVHLLPSNGAPGGIPEHDAAPAGSMALDYTTGAVYKKIAPGAGAANWEEMVGKTYVDNRVAGIHWRDPALVKDDTAYASLIDAETAVNTGTIDGIAVADGTRILFTGIAGQNANVFIVTGIPGSGATLVEDAHGLHDGDSIWVQDGTVADTLWNYNGVSWVQMGGSSSTELGYIRGFIGKNAPGLETPVYSVHTGGTVVYITDGDTLERAIALLDSAIDGVNANVTSVQAEVNNLENSLGASIDVNGNYVAHIGSNYIDGNTDLTQDILALDGQIKVNENGILLLQDDTKQTAVAGVTAATVLDAVPTPSVGEVSWLVYARQGTSVRGAVVTAIHNGTPGAGDASGTDFSIQQKQRIGNIPGLRFTIAIQGTGAGQTMALQGQATAATDFIVRRIGVVKIQ